MSKAIILIQARYDSKRCPGKILRKLNEGTTCLSYLTDRLVEANYNVRLATTYRAVDTPLVYEYKELQKKSSYLLNPFLGEEENVARRLYQASEGYEYVIRITGDDILVDVTLLNEMANYAIKNQIDYLYAPDLIRGLDCDIYKRSALLRVQELYDTRKVESIEFLVQNDNFKVEGYKGIYSYCKDQDISLTIDTEADFKLVKIIWQNLSKIDYLFTTWEIAKYIADNRHLLEINKKPKLTVYTVFKNYPYEWVKQAVESLDDQTYTDFEYIFVDYGSKQLHSSIKDLNNSEYHRVFFTESMSFVDAIRFAISKARGKYVLRLDADDYLYPDGLQKIMNYAREFPFYSGVFANHDRYSSDLKTLAEANVIGARDNVMSCALIEKKKYSFVDFFDKQSFRDGTNLLKAFNDHDLKIGYLNDSIFKYRIHENSLTHGTGKEKMIRAMDELILGATNG